MVKRATDRRVQRTRQLLQDALIAMMIEKGYEATTIQDIIDRANVGRATFYAHFADKETLLASRIEDLRAMLTRQQQQALATRGGVRERGLGFSLAMLEHARSHLPLYAMIVGQPSGAFVVQRIHRTIADLVALDLKGHEIRDRAVNALHHERTARLAHDHRIQRQVTAGMLEHREAEAQTSLAYSAPRRERLLLLPRQHGA